MQVLSILAITLKWFSASSWFECLLIAGRNNMESQDAVVASVLLEFLHDAEQKTRAVLLFSQILDEYQAAPNKASWSDMDRFYGAQWAHNLLQSRSESLILMSYDLEVMSLAAVLDSGCNIRPEILRISFLSISSIIWNWLAPREICERQNWKSRALLYNYNKLVFCDSWSFLSNLHSVNQLASQSLWRKFSKSSKQIATVGCGDIVDNHWVRVMKQILARIWTQWWRQKMP